MVRLFPLLVSMFPDSKFLSLDQTRLGREFPLCQCLLCFYNRSYLQSLLSAASVSWHKNLSTVIFSSAAHVYSLHSYPHDSPPASFPSRSLLRHASPSSLPFLATYL